jgi:hypothetical protein
MLLPVDGTVIETLVGGSGRGIAKADPNNIAEIVNPVSIKALALAYGVGDYPDAEPGEHPEPFLVDQHKYSLSLTGDGGSLEDGYGGYTLITYCCKAMQQWAIDLEAAISGDTVIERRSRMDDDAEFLNLDHPTGRMGG